MTTQTQDAEIIALMEELDMGYDEAEEILADVKTCSSLFVPSESNIF